MLDNTIDNAIDDTIDNTINNMIDRITINAMYEVNTMDATGEIDMIARIKTGRSVLFNL